MELNRKLTHLLKGCTIQSEFGDEDHVAITFDDESTLKLRVAGQATVSVGGFRLGNASFSDPRYATERARWVRR